MPFICKLVDIELIRSEGGVLLPGYMWYAPWYIENRCKPSILSKEYYRDWYGKRPPLIVVLPSGTHFMVDKRFSNTLNSNRASGWKVTGNAPNISVTPSIHYIYDEFREGYHGWLSDGMLGDDLEGREYSWRWGKGAR
jgi:hypothetical protein